MDVSSNFQLIEKSYISIVRHIYGDVIYKCFTVKCEILLRKIYFQSFNDENIIGRLHESKALTLQCSLSTYTNHIDSKTLQF